MLRSICSRQHARQRADQRGPFALCCILRPVLTVASVFPIRAASIFPSQPIMSHSHGPASAGPVVTPGQQGQMIELNSYVDEASSQVLNADAKTNFKGILAAFCDQTAMPPAN